MASLKRVSDVGVAMSPGERATGGEPVGLEPLLDDLVSVDRVDAQVLNAMPISGS
jgi:hypothetical protein